MIDSTESSLAAPDLDELMSRDPTQLSATDIDQIIDYHRRQRERRAAGEKPRTKATPEAVASIAEKLLRGAAGAKAAAASPLAGVVSGPSGEFDSPTHHRTKPMKRQSIAEQTLAKQVRAIDSQLAKLNIEIEALQQQRYSVQTIRDQLSDEIDRLRTARTAASIARKP